MNKMTPKEFREAGFLQELNRQFLHPLGLALEIILDTDGTERFGSVWDCREDPEGIFYQDVFIDPKRAEMVASLKASKRDKRTDLLGSEIQPCTGPEKK